MNNLISLDDSTTEYPDYFTVFLDNCEKVFNESFTATDYLFAAVYFITLETGFSPNDGVENGIEHCDSICFDVRKLRTVRSYSPTIVTRMNECIPPAANVYRIRVTLGLLSTHMCELQGVPSSEDGSYLIINFLSGNPLIVKSICLQTADFVDTKAGSNGKVQLINMAQLSVLIKNKILNEVKDSILLETQTGVIPNILRLPVEIQEQIIHYLTGAPESVGALSMTCSYFRDMIYSDVPLWETICLKNCEGRSLNDTMLRVIDEGDISNGNLFRQIFRRIKMTHRGAVLRL